MKNLYLKFLFSALFIFISAAAFAQTQTITGKVIDGGTNQPLGFATVVVKGTTNGTAADAKRSG